MRLPTNRNAAPAVAAVLSLIGLWFGGGLWAAEVPLKDQPHLRRPIAAAWLDKGKLLAVANQRSGSISIVDLEEHDVLAEVAVGERLADVAALPAAGWLLAVDEKRHELLVLQWHAGQLRIAQRIGVSRHPVSIAVSPDGSRVAVASLWSRTITTFAVKPAEEPEPPTLTRLNELVLSFAPGRQLYLPDGEHVLVADAFTGQMALLDVTAQSVVPIPADHVFRIYGLTLSAAPGGVYVAHQALQPLPPPKQAKGDNPSGERAMRLNNFVGEYSIAGLLSGRLQRFVADPAAPPSLGYFTGDLRQTAELAPALMTLTTNQRRQQVLAPAAGQPRVVVRRFRDELTVSDPDQPARETTIRLGPVGALTAADRGEALFYDTSLSATGWMSCHTCHPDGHTTGQLVDTLGDDSKGTHKRVLTLLGAGRTGKWAWNGDAQTLKSQVFQSLKTTMGKQSNPQITSDIAAYLQTLRAAPPPLQPASDDPGDEDSADKVQLRRGEALFERRGCVKCHVPASGYTSDATYDVGLRDEKGMTKFNPPSLRGVSQGYSFFHDGRAKTLEDVLITHRHPHGEALPAEDLADLLRFLRSL
jgi:cytochrome c peroxidase